jgi:hypothetical protein
VLAEVVPVPVRFADGDRGMIEEHDFGGNIGAEEGMLQVVLKDSREIETAWGCFGMFANRTGFRRSLVPPASRLGRFRPCCCR